MFRGRRILNQQSAAVDPTRAVFSTVPVDHSNQQSWKTHPAMCGACTQTFDGEFSNERERVDAYFGSRL